MSIDPGIRLEWGVDSSIKESSLTGLPLLPLKQKPRVGVPRSQSNPRTLKTESPGSSRLSRREWECFRGTKADFVVAGLATSGQSTLQGKSPETSRTGHRVSSPADSLASRQRAGLFFYHFVVSPRQAASTFA